jgi:hypothetical protein
MALDILENTSTWTAFIRSLSGTTDAASDPAYALHVRGGLEAYVSLRKQLSDSFNLLWKEVLAGRIEDYNAAGSMAVSACKVARRAGEELRRKLAEARQRGVPEDLGETFEAAVKDFEQADQQVVELLQTLESRWPWVNPLLYAAGAAESEDGKSRPARDVFDEFRRRVS